MMFLVYLEQSTVRTNSPVWSSYVEISNFIRYGNFINSRRPKAIFRKSFLQGHESGSTRHFSQSTRSYSENTGQESGFVQRFKRSCKLSIYYYYRTLPAHVAYRQL